MGIRSAIIFVSACRYKLLRCKFLLSAPWYSILPAVFVVLAIFASFLW
jgi:hypothetical protein